MKTAILVDAGFHLKRHYAIYKNKYPLSGEEVAYELKKHCDRHIYSHKNNNKQNDELYRIFIYDCEPLTKNIRKPVSQEDKSLKNTNTYKFRVDFHKTIKRLPQFALRLGMIDERYGQWEFKSEKTIKKLLKGEMNISDLTDEDFQYNAKQKGVDIKIGLDIATLAYKKFADKIILISGDSDFVPASKHARREGIIFELDPMHHKIKDDLLEHIDRLKSSISKKEYDECTQNIKNNAN